MAHPHFEETQTFRESHWIWILVVVSFLITILPPGDALYWQLLQGKPWGDKPMTNGGLPGLFTFVFVTWALAMTMLIFNPIAEKNFCWEGKNLRFLDTR